MLRILFNYTSRSSVMILFSIFFLLNACKEDKPPLPIDAMSKIMLEMYVAESYALFVPKDSTKNELKNEDSLQLYFASILKENKTSRDEFNKSIDWYKKKPEMMDSIYQQILSDLKIWQSRLSIN